MFVRNVLLVLVLISLCFYSQTTILPITKRFVTYLTDIKVMIPNTYSYYDYFKEDEYVTNTSYHNTMYDLFSSIIHEGIL